MSDRRMTARVEGRNGFIAALDQSGGSTPEALRLYGVPESSYGDEAEMFRLMHEMRVRVMTAPAFTGDKILGAILFEQTMDGQANGKPVPAFLWDDKGVVPFLKVDKGREAEVDGVKLMKPNPGLDALLERAVKRGIYGTKMRSVIRLASRKGIADVVAQQFEVAAQITRAGLMPIIEPEVLIDSPSKAEAEEILRTELTRGLDTLRAGEKVMLKLTLPTVPDFYRPLAGDDRVACVVALSGGYDQAEACNLLARNHDVIGSFSRALLERLQRDMPDAAFNSVLGASIDAIYAASTHKH